MNSRVICAVAALALVAVPLAAQQRRQAQTFGPAAWRMSPEYRQVQRSALDAQRRLLLSMADSMPENLYRDRVTPPQRDFAQQLHHVVSANVLIATNWIATDGAAPASDTTAIFGSREGMRQYINTSYDYLTGLLDRGSEDDRNTVVQFFGGMRIPRWQVWDELNQHASWTLGQVVANFRKHGKAPPPFLFF
jgi:hypothetical protein